MSEIIPYSAWEKPSDDATQNLRDYADYVREHHFKGGNLQQFEQEIQKGIRDRALQDGLFDPNAPEDDENNALVFDKLFGRKQDSQDSDLEFLKNHYVAQKDNERAGAIRRYQASKRVGNQESIDQSLEAITPFATKENIREARKAAADRGDVSFIAIEDEDEDGETFRYIYTAPDAEAPSAENRASLLSSLKSNGAIQSSDLLRLEYDLQVEPGTSVPRFAAQRARDFHSQIPSVLENDEELSTLISGVSVAESNRRSFENDSDFVQGLKRTGISLMGGVSVVGMGLLSGAKTLIKGARGEGFNLAENFEKDTDVLRSTGGLYGNRWKIIEKLSKTPLGEKFSENELNSYIDDLVKLNMAPEFDDNEPERNFLRLSTGRFVAHEALLANPALHDAQVDTLEIEPRDKAALKAERRFRLAASAASQRDRIIKVFGSDAVEKLNEIKEAGGDDVDFVESYLSDEDNFSSFKNSWGMIGTSIVAAPFEAVLGLGQAGFQLTEELGKTASHYGDELGSELLQVAGEEAQSISQSGISTTSKGVYGIQNFKSKFSEKASLFGKNVGLFTEIASVIPQVATDLLATRGIMAGKNQAIYFGVNCCSQQTFHIFKSVAFGQQQISQV